MTWPYEGRNRVIQRDNNRFKFTKDPEKSFFLADTKMSIANEDSEEVRYWWCPDDSEQGPEQLAGANEAVFVRKVRGHHRYIVITWSKIVFTVSSEFAKNCLEVRRMANGEPIYDKLGQGYFTFKEAIEEIMSFT